MNATDITSMNIHDVRRELTINRMEFARLDLCEKALLARMRDLLGDAQQRAVAGVRVVEDCCSPRKRNRLNSTIRLEAVDEVNIPVDRPVPDDHIRGA